MSIRSFTAQLATLALFGVLSVGAAVSAAAEDAPAGTVQTPQPPSISVTTARVRELVSALTVTGTLTPRETVVVGADVEGLRVAELLAEEGDMVTRGEVLARLETDMIDTDLAQNTAQIARAEAALGQAQTQIENAQSVVKEAEAALARAQPLAKKGIVGQDVLDQRVQAATSARASLANARQGVAVAEADKAVLEATRKQLELRKSKAEIKAPTDGLVLSRSVRLGGIVSSASGALFEIARDGLIELAAAVPETQLAGLSQGQPVTVHLPGSEKSFEGKIRLVSPKVDETTRLGDVRIALPKSDALHAGSFARGVVEIARDRGVVVPRTAVIFDGDKATVQVVENGTVKTRTVETGISDGDSIEIRTGVKEGEDVVALAGTFVRDGDAVTPVPMKTAEAE
ncbi:efflux RND transporter periplasmic adaptor subunit [Aurantimonas sp. VKM B-3413]|uniref:efflux RND transporter periplasmic adaptor subunit n=1 Tax=Aurantimonas sp. VKM B-3413 TaxID=2779401 RepID=UPI001E5D015D|nr:efflux RND transporter periplasmic adaptor subunit [Aurantimonas sp. VKM B-3413]MCB8836987.1 efflux RND transporter periplasmic adaptor subunit [Aurantimonas sp. VKM B-3413]